MFSNAIRPLLASTMASLQIERRMVIEKS
jgi:hypothetical protein